ncbi:hypothetical protein MKX03_018069 [Papaver bracteatum]|nr:hypothetical protein MKX03_018069 [Papaver bracteatum]
MKQGEPMMDIWLFKEKNMKNCRRSTRLKERTYCNSFTWFKLFSRKWDSLSKCELLSLTKSEILLWQNGVLSCYDPKTLKKIWYAEAAKEFIYQAVPHMHSLVSLKDIGEKLVGRSERHPRIVATR